MLSSFPPCHGDMTISSQRHDASFKIFRACYSSDDSTAALHCAPHFTAFALLCLTPVFMLRSLNLPHKFLNNKLITLNDDFSCFMQLMQTSETNEFSSSKVVRV